MDLTFPPEADEFRATVRAFLEANLPADRPIFATDATVALAKVMLQDSQRIVDVIPWPLRPLRPLLPLLPLLPPVLLGGRLAKSTAPGSSGWNAASTAKRPPQGHVSCAS